MLSNAVLEPGEEGVNTTEMLQLLFGATVFPQLFV
jgi:hypothetical protein